ncbi:MAG: hypothetical protein ABR609_07865 [Acidimicrobiia bacterium]
MASLFIPTPPIPPLLPPNHADHYEDLAAIHLAALNHNLIFHNLIFSGSRDFEEELISELLSLAKKSKEVL